MIHALGPDEGFRVRIIEPDVFLNGLHEFGHAFEAAPPDAFARDFAKPPLHQVEPGRTRGREVQVEAPMALQPLLHLRMLVRRIVVHDQMEGQG